MENGGAKEERWILEVRVSDEFEFWRLGFERSYDFKWKTRVFLSFSKKNDQKFSKNSYDRSK